MSFLFGALCAVILSGIVLIFKSVVKVEEGHRTLLTAFGKIRTDQNGATLLLESGIHFKKPWERAHEFSIMERVMGVKDGTREVEVLARDGTLLRLDPQVRLEFDPERAEVLLFGVNRLVVHLRELFRGILSRHLAGDSRFESEDGSYAEIRRNGRGLNEYLKQVCGRELDSKYGVRLRAVDLAQILPPADIAQALNSVSKAEADNETLYKRVAAECEQRIASAEHGVEIALTRAEATKAEILTLGKAVAELRTSDTLNAYIRRREHEVSSISKTVYLKN